MSAGENAVFKMVSLRGAGEGASFDPTEGTPSTELESRRALDPAELEGLGVARLAKAMGDRTDFRADDLARIYREYSDAPAPDVLQSEYARLVDSWLVGRLSGRAFPARIHERLIRVARLWIQYLRHPETFATVETAYRLLHAKVALPPEVKAIRSGTHLPPRAAQAQIAKAERARFATISSQIARREAIQRKAQELYAERTAAASAAATTDARRNGTRVGGLLARASAAVFGVPSQPVLARPAPVPLDDDFYASLRARLAPAEAADLQDLLGGHPTGAPRTLGGLLNGVLDIGDLVLDANDLCSRIHAFEDETQTSLPPPRPLSPDAVRPSVRAIGWGDLIVARERLVGYEAREIAHVENILPGESKVRKHDRTVTSETVSETETTRKQESERDLQTTDRNEMQHEVSSTIQENFSTKAGVNTSGRYGLTKVDTSLDVGFERGATEARSATVELAKEIVAKTVERVFETVRELRRTTLTERIRELNTHRLANTVAGGGTPTPISGVYLWVEKVQEVSLHHYGTRLMVEFHIPEPGVSLFSHSDKGKVKRRKPAALTIGPADVTSANYLCYAKAFGARDLAPPPPLYVDVGYSWRSAPDESADADEAEDTISDTIAIPTGYQPISGSAHVTGIPFGNGSKVYAYLAVGGYEVIDGFGHASDNAWNFDQGASWPNGVPVSMASHGQFDKTMVVHVTIRCQRTAEAMVQWQIQTWQKIRDAHEALMQEYERAVLEAEADAATLVNVTGRAPTANRELERDELKKWAIKVMRVESFDDSLVDAVVQVGAHAEIDPIAADAQAPIVRFFEEAFEWRELSYFLYPYFWGRRDAWDARLGINGPDPVHDMFLRAGAARVIVPVTPGYEERVLYYLDSDPARPELERIANPAPGTIPPETDVEEMWLDLLVEKNTQLALGTGTLRVTHGDAAVTINADSRWDATDRDLGREIYLAGEQYAVQEVTGLRSFMLDRPYQRQSDPAARYATGSVPFGAPWLVRIPTNLVILRENTGLLEP